MNSYLVRELLSFSFSQHSICLFSLPYFMMQIPSFQKFPDDMGDNRTIKTIFLREKLVVVFFELDKMCGQDLCTGAVIYLRLIK